MAIICREHKLLFIMVPGTGCSVVGRMLQQELGGEFIPEYPIRKNGHTVVARKHNTLPEILSHGLMTREEREEYLVFASIRSPFDRWVTYYQRYVGDWLEEYEGVARRKIDRDKKKFEIDDEELQLRHRQLDQRMKKLRRRRMILRNVGFNFWMTGTSLRWWWKGRSNPTRSLDEFVYPMLEDVDAVIRQERLNEGLNTILSSSGVDQHIDLPRKNETGGKKPYQSYYAWPTRKLAELLFGRAIEKYGYRFEGNKIDASVIWR